MPASRIESVHRSAEGLIGYVRCPAGHLVIHRFPESYPKPAPPASVIELRERIWAAFVGFTQIAETIDGDITAESFFEAAGNTSALDLDGMVPVLDFTQEWTDGLEGFNRLFNRSVVFSELDNGQVVPLTTEFEDVGALATGDAG